MDKIIIKKANAAIKKYERTAKRRTLTEKERIKYTILKVRVGKATIQVEAETQVGLVEAAGFWGECPDKCGNCQSPPSYPRPS